MERQGLPRERVDGNSHGLLRCEEVRPGLLRVEMTV